jgi:hypothetical protein
MTRYVPVLALTDKDSGFYAISGVLLPTVVTNTTINMRHETYDKITAHTLASVLQSTSFNMLVHFWFKNPNYIDTTYMCGFY